MNRKWILRIIGVVIGAAAGYIYYVFEGCDQGCPITGSPFTSSLYGAWMGLLTLTLFEK